MKRPQYSTLQIWAFRDILRRPIESLLLAAAMTSTIAIVGTLLLFPRAVYDTVDRLLDAAPAIVVRRIDAAGWQPLPTDEAVQAARTVPGVVSLKPRIWGIVNGPDGPLTVIGFAPGTIPEAYKGLLPRLPEPGQAIVGPGVAAGESAEILQLEGSMRGTYQVIGRLPDNTGIFTHDLVLLNAQDARKLISLPDGYASDLAVDVFHEGEQDAILVDLAAAFPWPVRCVTRRQSAGIYAGGLDRSGTLGTIAVIPAVLAVCLLVAVNIRKSMGRQSDLGIMKAMGWTTGDIVRLQLYRALSVGLPSAAIGVCLSFFLVYWPGTSWLGTIFLGWETIPPKLYLAPQGAITVLLEVAGFVLAPVIGSALLPAVKAATVDVHELIEGARSR
jgi:cell division protein FtsX